MTHLTVAISVQSLDQALAAAAVAAERGADLVEYRVDTFTGDLPALTALVERSALPCIVTCRPTWEGGAYEGDEGHRLAVFEHACAGTRRPAYIDVELAAYQRGGSPDANDSFRGRIDALVDHPGHSSPVDTGLILSSHDFKSRPRDLLQRVAAMVEAPACRVVKVAWSARSLRDNVEAFELQSSRVKPTIALCMGEHGLPSRVLARKFGALLTFAAPPDAPGTASGQPRIDDLKRLYRWDAITPSTRVFGVIGHPVGHSLSPSIHNAGFDAVGYDGVYLPMPIAPSYESLKATLLTWLDCPGLDFRGASVTIPHKANLLQFVKEQGGHVDALADRIGAANTLIVGDDGKLSATNTDYAAALDAVCDGMGVGRDELADLRIAVIGAGGAAAAIVAGFASCGATVVVYNRTLEKAQALAARFNAPPGITGKVVAARLAKLCDSCCHVYINCTPIGMHPNVDESPMPATEHGDHWSPGAVVFDTIYNPIETRLLREARAAGCVTIPGIEMFVRQAADQFKMWTAREAPMELFREVVTRQLRG